MKKVNKQIIKKGWCLLLSILLILTALAITPAIVADNIGENDSTIGTETSDKKDTDKDRSIKWDVQMNFTAAGGTTNVNDWVIFGEAPDASDGVDIYDAPNPPGGVKPYIDSYFTTPFTSPNNELQQEIKHYPDVYKVWNLTVQYENSTSNPVTVTTEWDPNDFTEHEYDSVVLMWLNSSSSEWEVAADMLTESSFVHTPEFIDIGGNIIWLPDVFTINCSKIYTLDVTIEGSGDVALSPPGGVYTYGTIVTLTPNPAVGWAFDHWDGALSGSTVPEHITMDDDYTVIANFSENVYTLTIEIEGSGGVILSPPGGVYTYGTIVTLTPNPAVGWAFDHWDGALSGSTVPEHITMDDDYTVIANFSENVYTLTIEIEGSGGVILSPPGGVYTYGTIVTLTPNPAVGWAFDHWDGALSGSTVPEHITMDDDYTVIANFSENVYTLTIEIEGSGGVILSPPGGVYTYGTIVTLTPNPAVGWAFDHWDGALSGSTVPEHITMDDDYTVIANFSENVYTLTIEIEGSGGVILSPPGGVYTYGTIVTLTPNPAVGWAFDHWDGALSGSTVPEHITMDDDYTVIANFSENVYTLTIEIEGSGGVILSPPGGVYTYGAIVTLTPNPAVGWAFDHWDGALSGSTVPEHITMDDDYTVIANFSENVYTLTIEIEGSGGVILSPPGGVYTYGAIVTLTPNPAVGWAFDHWDGALSGSTVPEHITMDDDYTVIANFSENVYTLTIEIEGSGGVILSPPGGVYTYGTIVTLTPNPAVGWAFDHWDGALSGSTVPEHITMDDDYTVIANFSENVYTLTIEIEGSGGVILSPPGGVYTYGTIVTLTPNPAVGWAFDHWDGALSGSTVPEHITMDDDYTVIANFSENVYTLTIEIEGSGGVILSPPGGVYTYGTIVTLTPNPAVGWAFDHWDGALSGSTVPEHITMDDDYTVIANFSENVYTLTIEIEGSGGVILSPPGGVYTYGTIVTLTPNPAVGWAFDHWDGALSGSTVPEHITMDDDYTVIANFSENVYTLTIEIEGSGGVILSPPGGVYTYGAIVTLTPNPAVGWAFDHWDGALSGSTVPEHITMDDDYTVIANFSENVYTLTIEIEGSGGVILSPPGGVYTYGAIVTLTPNPAVGWAFDHWDGALSGSTVPEHITMDDDYTVIANFSENVYTLTIEIEGSGGVILSPPGGVYTYGAIVTLTPNPAVGWAFDHWDGALSGSTVPEHITMDDDYTVIANFSENVYTLTIEIEGSGGVILSPPGGVYTYGAIVTLTPNPAVGWAFDHWDGALSGSTVPEHITMDDDYTVIANFSENVYTLTIEIEGSGGVILSPPGGVYTYGTIVTLTPNPAVGWAFDHWDGALSGSTVPEHITMDDDYTVIANFSENVYTLTIEIEGSGGVILSPPGGVYTYGTIVTLTPNPAVGWAFDHWDGALSGSTVPEHITMDDDYTVIANFSENVYTLTIEIEGSGGVILSPPGGVYTYGTIVTLTPNPAVGWAFDHWDGALSGSTVPEHITMDDDYTVIANFSENVYTLTIEIEGSGGVILSPPGGVYTYGTIVTLTPNPAVGWAFDHWDGALSGSTVPEHITMDDDYTVIANFSENVYTLTIEIEGSGGVILSPPGGVYTYGTIVTLTPNPAVGWAFDHWDGALSGSTVPEHITMDDDYTVIANFSENVYTLTIEIEGSGGVILSPPGGVYTYGTIVTLTPNPAVGWAFDHWDGALSGSTVPEHITMDDDYTVIANFSENVYTLTIEIEGSGGVILSPPGGVYTYGTIVTLTPNPAVGWAFDHWDGALSGSTVPEHITMDDDYTVIANFSENVYTLTIEIEGSGGVILSPPGGVYTYGAIVTLTPNPAVGWAFDHWDGALSGSTVPEHITMDDDYTVIANFSENVYTLTIEIEGSGGVILSPPGGVYTYGAIVTLTPNPAVGWAFDHWDGALSGSTVPEHITMDDDYTVIANFSENVYTLTIEIEGSGGVILSPPGGVYTYGAIVTLTPNPAVGWAFDHWDGALSGSTVPEHITMDDDYTVIANFTQLTSHIISLSTKWNLVSIPCYENIDKTEITVRNNTQNHSWTDAVSLGIILDDVYDWDRLNQEYVIVSTFGPGKSYWMIANFECELIIYSDATGAGEITNLLVNWSLVGLPYEEIVNKTDLIIHCQGHNITWADAVNSSNPTGNPIIISFIYGWDRVHQYYTFSDTLEPGYGYWIFAYQECTLKKPVPP